MSVFESRVVLDGSQTIRVLLQTHLQFESRVVLDGSQTFILVLPCNNRFESRVVLDGSQTEEIGESESLGLRVVLF